MKPEELKPPLFKNMAQYTPEQLADALESAMEAQHMASTNDTDTPWWDVEVNEWYERIKELRGMK